MVLLLRQLGIECLRQDEYEIRYKDKRVGLQRLDIPLGIVVNFDTTRLDPLILRL